MEPKIIDLDKTRNKKLKATNLIDKLKSEQEVLQDEYNTLLDKIDELEENLSEFNNKERVLNNLVEELKKQISDKEMEHKSELDQLKNQHNDDILSLIKDYESKLSDLDTKKNKEIQERIKTLKNRLRIVHTLNLNKEITDKSNEYKEDLESKTKLFEEEIKKLSDEKDRLESEKNKIINQLEKQIKTNLYNFTKLHNKNKDKIDKLQENLIEEQRLKEEFEIELSEKMTEIDSLKPSKSILESKVKLLNDSKFLDQKTLIKSLKDDIQKYEDEIINYKIKSDEKDKEIVKINDELLHKDKKINNIKEGLNRLANSLLKSSYKQPTLNLR